MWNSSAPIKAAPGIVAIQANTILRVIPHRTAVSLREAPTPTIAPVIVCVVLTGMPKCAVLMSVIAPAVSARIPEGRQFRDALTTVSQ